MYDLLLLALVSAVVFLQSAFSPKVTPLQTTVAVIVGAASAVVTIGALIRISYLLLGLTMTLAIIAAIIAILIYRLASAASLVDFQERF